MKKHKLLWKRDRIGFLFILPWLVGIVLFFAQTIVNLLRYSFTDLQVVQGQGFVFNDLLTNYERVADHCSNIAVALIELESDSFDTHEYLNSLKELKSDMYERYYEEYRRVYQL